MGLIYSVLIVASFIFNDLTFILILIIISVKNDIKLISRVKSKIGDLASCVFAGEAGKASGLFCCCLM